MNKSIKFKLAHIITRATIQADDNYQVTFAQTIKMLNSQLFNGSEKQITWAKDIVSNFANDLVAVFSQIQNSFSKIPAEKLLACKMAAHKAVATVAKNLITMTTKELIDNIAVEKRIFARGAVETALKTELSKSI